MSIRVLRLLALAVLLTATSPVPVLAEHWIQGRMPVVEANYINEKLSRPHKLYSLDTRVARGAKPAGAMHNWTAHGR